MTTPAPTLFGAAIHLQAVVQQRGRGVDIVDLQRGPRQVRECMRDAFAAISPRRWIRPVSPLTQDREMSRLLMEREG
jgi:hypothetical protein